MPEASGEPDEPVPGEESIDEEGDYLVWAENWDTVEVFRACGTQWIVQAGFAGSYFQGIDYVKLRTVMAFKRVKLEHREAMFEDIRAMEAAAQPLRNKTLADAAERLRA